MEKLILMALSGQLTEASPQKPTRPHWPLAARVFLHHVGWHFIIWHYTASQPALLGVMRECQGWSREEEGDQGNWISIRTPGHLPSNNCIFPKKHSFSLKRESKMTVVQLFPSPRHSLLALAEKNRCLPVPSVVTGVLEMVGRGPEKPQL